MIQRGLDCILLGGLFAVLATALLGLDQAPAGLASAVQLRLHESGVDNPVTAVLLNFRAYDTLLEVGVLLLALVAVWSVAPPLRRTTTVADPELSGMTRLLVPAMTIGGGYLLWIGAFAPGGAFQAGAMLAGALVLMQLTGMRGALDLVASRALLALGLFVFMAAGLAPLLWGHVMLQYPVQQAKTFILVIEAAAMISIAVTLGALFAGGRPHAGDRQ